MQDDKFFEDLVCKMIKAANSRNKGAFWDIKAVFTSLVAKQEEKPQPAQFAQPAQFLSFGNIEYLRDAIKIDELARRVRDRWYKTCQDKKIKYPQKNLESKLINNFENKRLSLEKKGIFVPQDAYYELMSVGYAPEKITKKKNGFLLPALTGNDLVIKSKEDFENFVKQHEKNFKSSVEKRLEG